MTSGTQTDWSKKDLAQWYNANMRGNISAYASLFGFCEEDKVLDLGCGDGTLLSIAASKGAKVVVDISDEQLELSKQKLANVSDYKLVKISLQEIDFPSHSFTKISIRKAIHHLTNDEKGVLLDKIYKWLVPGGIVIIEDMILSFALHKREENLALVEREAIEYYGKEKWPGFRDAFFTTMFKELPCDLAQLTHHLLFVGFHIPKIITQTSFMATVIAEK